MLSGNREAAAGDFEQAMEQNKDDRQIFQYHIGQFASNQLVFADKSAVNKKTCQ